MPKLADGEPGVKSQCWGIRLRRTDSKSRVTEFPVMAKVSDIQSSTQKPQQFKPIFLNTALTASEISEFSHKHLGTKTKGTKRRLHLSAAFSELYKHGDSSPSQCRTSLGPNVFDHQTLVWCCGIWRLPFKSLQAGDWLGWTTSSLNLSFLLGKMRVTVAWTGQAAEQIQWGTRGDSVL